MTSALKIRQLGKQYADGFEALKGIDLTVEPGDFFALLGPNGAGKSTTIGIISSLVNKTAGSVEVFGHNIDTQFSLAKQKIGIVPQEFNFNNFEKVIDILVTQAGYYGIPSPLAHQRAEKYLKKLGIWDKRDTPSRNLSGGMKRRLMIARALVHEPELLILDEPTAGVDIELRRSMWGFLQEINEAGRTIILTTHYLEEAEHLCRNIAIIDQGLIVENTSMKSLLQTLQKETFIFDSREMLSKDFSLKDYDCTVVGENNLEVSLGKEQSLNALFAVLTDAGLDVISMRNKTNRLEELFVNLVDNQLEGTSEEGGKR